MAEPTEVAGEAGQHGLRFGIAEAHVVLENLHTLRREHEPGVENPAVRDVARRQRVERRSHRALHDLPHDVGAGDGNG